MQKRPSPRTREKVEDRSRYYDVDNAVASSRPWSPLIDRQCLSPITERQLQTACLFLSRKMEFPDSWNEFDICADLTDASPSSSHFPDLKISSFAIPDHIASAVYGDTARGSDVLSNENQNGIADAEDKCKSGVPVDLIGNQELTHDSLVDVFGPGRSVVPLDADEASKSLSSVDESKCQSHFSSEKALAGISSKNNVTTDIQTIEEHMPSEIKQEDTRLRSTIPLHPANEVSQSLASSKEQNMSRTESQILQNPQLEGSDTLSSPGWAISLNCQTATNTKQKLKVDTNLSPIFDDHTLSHTQSQSWSSRSAGGKVIIDVNGLEKVMTVDEERQRRLGLQRAVMEKMSGGCSASALNTPNKAATLRSNFPTQSTSPFCDITTTCAKGPLNKSPEPNLGGQTQHVWDQQTKNTLVRKLSRITHGKKKSVAKMNNVLGFSAIVEAR
ncbi:hypothetical protein ACJ72_01549 [Emergomyces africanus]|uniref:Uncharacterized protein n=1 Tax=Emergomyces africanus TaxID=1955775 RepID=A0A1B7P4X6_9EURO|nr:hypothetical protein ACJ72_01549 [Emergomyces africanus]